MTYYDDFELKCGCRMWYKCDKARYCATCEKTQIVKAGAYGVHRCRECGSEVKV